VEVTKVHDANGHDQSKTYTPTSNVSQLTDAGSPGQTTSLGYDVNDNLSSIQSPSSGTGITGAKTTMTYNNGSFKFYPDTSTDGQGNCANYSYDPAGNMTSVTSGETSCGGSGTVTTNAYQGDTGVGSCTADGLTTTKSGLLCSTTDGNTHTVSYSCDNNGNLTKVTPPSPLGATTITPDSISRVTLTVDGLGLHTNYYYDADDRITEITYHGDTGCTSTATCITFSYDANGNLTSRVDNTGTTSYVYDAMNRTTDKYTSTGANPCSGWAGMHLTFDPVGNLATYCDAGGTVTYTYDPVNNLTKLAEPGGNCTSTPVVNPCTTFGYDSNNRRHTITYPSGEAITIDYTNAGVEKDVIAKRPSGTTFLSRTYSYIKTSTDRNVLQSVTDQAGTTTSYAYDTLNRLHTATTGSIITTYNYDAGGNRTSLAQTSASTIYYGYNNADEMCWTGTTSGSGCTTTPAGDTAYTYDGDGNLTAAGATAYTYNYKNQTTQIGATTFNYAGPSQTERVTAGTTSYVDSPLGTAVQTTSSTSLYTTRDPNGNLISLRQGAGSSSTNNYYTLDTLGSVLAATGPTGLADLGTYTYDAYGQTTSTGGTSPTTNPYRYTGGVYDPTTVTKLGQRYLNSGLGRWTQRDPVPGFISSPSAMDRYDYVGDDPLNGTDSNGSCFSVSVIVSVGNCNGWSVGVGLQVGADFGASAGSEGYRNGPSSEVSYTCTASYIVGVTAYADLPPSSSGGHTNGSFYWSEGAQAGFGCGLNFGL
jgi:RHS repeat-associated protein